MKITIEEMRAEIACEHEKRRKNFAKWVRSGTMTQADADISRFVRVSEFSDDRMMRAVKSHPHLLRNFPDIEGLSEMFEQVYNHAFRSPIPLAFRAKEEAKKRQDVGAKHRAKS